MAKFINILSNNAQGGVEQSYLDYTKALLKDSNNEVLCLMNKRAKTFPKAQEICEVRAFNPASNKNSYLNPFAVKKLKKIISENKPDALICHNGKSVALVRKALGENNKVKLVAVNHGTKLKRLEKADAIFSVNLEMQQQAEEKYPEKLTALVPNMIDLGSFMSWEGGSAIKEFQQPITIGSLARFTEEKNHEYFIEVLKILKNRAVKFNAVIAGDGELRNDVEHLVAERGIEDEVGFIGWVEDKKQFFDSIDIFCLHSKSETFGLTILEAMAYTKVVLSTDCDGPKDIMQGVLKDCLCDKNSPEAMADTIDKISNNPDSIKKLKSANKDVLNNYSFEKISSLIQENLKMIISS